MLNDNDLIFTVAINSYISHLWLVVCEIVIHEALNINHVMISFLIDKRSRVVALFDATRRPIKNIKDFGVATAL